MQRSFPEPVGLEVVGISGITDDTAPGFEFITPDRWELLQAQVRGRVDRPSEVLQIWAAEETDGAVDWGSIDFAQVVLWLTA
jgi:hypothetical protein